LNESDTFAGQDTPARRRSTSAMTGSTNRLPIGPRTAIQQHIGGGQGGELGGDRARGHGQPRDDDRELAMGHQCGARPRPAIATRTGPLGRPPEVSEFTANHLDRRAGLRAIRSRRGGFSISTD
jgi:hypothetical protein